MRFLSEAHVCYSGSLLSSLAQPLWLCQARHLHAQKLKEEERDDTSGECSKVP